MDGIKRSMAWCVINKCRTNSGNFRTGVELQCVTERDNEYEKNNMDATKEHNQRRQNHRSKIRYNGKGT